MFKRKRSVKVLLDKGLRTIFGWQFHQQWFQHFDQRPEMRLEAAPGMN
jgi:hypothetical protein